MNGLTTSPQQWLWMASRPAHAITLHISLGQWAGAVGLRYSRWRGTKQTHQKHLIITLTNTNGSVILGARWAITKQLQPFNGLFSRTTWVSRYQKGKTNLDFTGASGSGISWAICKSAPHSRQITIPVPHHSVFYRPDALPAAQPTASKHWRHKLN